MALSFRKNMDRGTVGLDIDGRFLAAVQTDGGAIRRAVTTDLPAGLVSEGEVIDPGALAEELKRFASEAGLPRGVQLGVANQQIVVRVVELPPIEDAQEREAAVRFQAAEAIAMPLDEAVLDHQVTGRLELPDGGERMQVVLVAARRAMIDVLVEAVKAAGLRPEGIDLDAFALVRTLVGDDSAGDAARVYCHLGGVTNLAIAVGPSCLFTRPLSTGWEEGAAAASGLADEVRLSIDYYMTQVSARPVREVVLSGPGSRDEGLVAALADQLAVPALVAEPLGGLDLSAADVDGDHDRFTVAAGLALGASS